MTEFDPEKFEEKYIHYLPQLQRAYKAAFSVMNDRRDSTIVHAIDQHVLNESEPFYQGADANPSFRVELPENPYERLQGIPVERDRFETILEEYVDTLERSLEDEFLG